MDQNNKRKRVAYKEYKLNMRLICKQTKQQFKIIGRNHPQRTLHLAPLETISVLGHKIQTANWTYNYPHWRTVRELRKHYILITGTAQVLYG